MKKLIDGSILVQGAVDGPFEPLHASRVCAVANPLLVHQLQHGRPQDLSHADKQERIKALIRDLRSKTPSLTFAQAWERVQRSNPELFDEP